MVASAAPDYSRERNRGRRDFGRLLRGKGRWSGRDADSRVRFRAEKGQRSGAKKGLQGDFFWDSPTIPARLWSQSPSKPANNSMHGDPHVTQLVHIIRQVRFFACRVAFYLRAYP